MDIKLCAERISSLVDEFTPEMFSMLKEAVNMDSGSHDVEDVNALGEYLSRRLKELGGEVLRHHPDRAVGDPLSGIFLPEGAARDVRRLLLVGHRDTVFPAGTVARRPFSRDAANCYGPGVLDQKGGNVAGFFAIKTLLAMQELTPCPPVEIIYTTDEEIGSSGSGPYVTERCKNAKAAFFLEPARVGGELVLARDGGSLFRINVYGKGAHAGNSFQEGVSAVNALAAITLECSALSNDPAGYNVNFGLVGGGSGSIVVPEQAWAEVWCRYSTLEQIEMLLGQIRKILDSHNRNGIRVEMGEVITYQPFRESADNDRLFEITREAGRAFGLELKGIATGGAADAGLTAVQGVPTLDGLGPIGGNMHVDEEYLVSASLPERTKVLALAMLLADRAFK
ncbi:MAG: M20 family metallopeptidase [Deltaproteobacteria bacterium]|jgi:glutamate carboxypeptidase|nr:M20 family metallopeptidase [Deltaproteobacteria bacterium]